MYVKSLFLILWLATFGVSAHQTIVRYNYLPSLFSSPHSKKLIKHRNEIHQDALMKIKNEFNINNRDWNWYIDYLHDIISKDDLFSDSTYYQVDKNDHWLMKEAKKVLIECGVNLNRIEIVFDYSEGVNGSAGQALDTRSCIIKHTLTLNPNWFSVLSLNEREAVLRHEVMHFVHYDNLEESYLLGLLEYLKIPDKHIEYNPAIINYRQQRELRADLLAVVDKPLLIRSEQNRFNSYIEETRSYPIDFWKTHPDYSTRAQNMAQLLTYVTSPIAA